MKKNDLNIILYVFGGFIIIMIVLSIIVSLFNFVFGLGYRMMGGGMMMGMMGIGSIFFLIPIAGIFLVVYWIFNKDDAPKREGKEYTDRNSAIRNLDNRYAKGELTREQYLIIKNDILEKI